MAITNRTVNIKINITKIYVYEVVFQLKWDVMKLFFIHLLKYIVIFLYNFSFKINKIIKII